MGGSAFRVVLLTNGNPHALRMLRGLSERGIPVDAVLLESASFRTSLSRSRKTASVLKALSFDLARWARAKLRALRARTVYGQYALEVMVTGHLNGEKMKRDLIALRPDLVVLGGIGILEESIITIPRYGAVNSHPGLLPWVRGTGVVCSAIHEGFPIGCTCHYVDTGIDRGSVIDRRLLHLDGSPTSLATLEHRADDLAAQMMVDLLTTLIETGEAPQAQPQTSKFPLCTWMSRKERRAVDVAVKRGRAKELFDLWKAGSVDGCKYRLPHDFVAPEQTV